MTDRQINRWLIVTAIALALAAGVVIVATGDGAGDGVAVPNPSEHDTTMSRLGHVRDELNSLGRYPGASDDERAWIIPCSNEAGQLQQPAVERPWIVSRGNVDEVAAMIVADLGQRGWTFSEPRAGGDVVEREATFQSSDGWTAVGNLLLVIDAVSIHVEIKGASPCAAA